MNVHLSGWVFCNWRSRNAVSMAKHQLMLPDNTDTNCTWNVLIKRVITPLLQTLPPIGQTCVSSYCQYLLAVFIWVSRCTGNMFTALFYCEPDMDKKKKPSGYSHADLITRASVWQVPFAEKVATCTSKHTCYTYTIAVMLYLILWNWHTVDTFAVPGKFMHNEASLCCNLEKSTQNYSIKAALKIYFWEKNEVILWVEQML